MSVEGSIYVTEWISYESCGQNTGILIEKFFTRKDAENYLATKMRNKLSKSFKKADIDGASYDVLDQMMKKVCHGWGGAVSAEPDE